MLSPVTHILPLTRIRRARLLPAGGRVLVQPGQKVSAIDIIAECSWQNRHALIDVRNSLRLNRKEPLDQVLERRIGERVVAGDILAQKGGLFKRVVRAPLDGEIVHIGSGRVMIEAQGQPFQLRAGYSGEVVEIVPELGAVIEASGALVQGVWGNGRIDMGMLLNLAQSPDDALTRERLDVSMRGAVILAGHCPAPDALQVADELPLRGLILGSMTAEAIPVAAGLQYPLIVLEGFGRIPINSTAYKILTTNEKRDIALNAAAWNAPAGERPEAMIPLPAEAEIPVETDTFKSGQTVRVVGLPYSGQIGVITKILPGRTRLASGLLAAAAGVRLESNVQVTVPLSNLDVLE